MDTEDAADRGRGRWRLSLWPAREGHPAFSVPFFRAVAARRDRRQHYVIEVRLVPCPSLGQRPVLHRHEVQVGRLGLKRVQAIDHLAHLAAHLLVLDARHLRPGYLSAVRVT